MRFTRRRWDAWCLGGALFLALGGAADTLYLSGRPWSALVFPAPVAALLLLRFRLPAEGFEATPLSRLGVWHRRHIVWCVGLMPVLLAAAALTPRLEAWWIYAVVAGALMGVTMWLARRADRERGVG